MLFLFGPVLWGATVLVAFVTGNSTPLPAIVLLGGFLVPVTFIAWVYERAHGDDITVELLFSAFVIGGLLGALASSLLEGFLPPPTCDVHRRRPCRGGAKAAAPVFAAGRMTHRTPRGGLAPVSTAALLWLLRPWKRTTKIEKHVQSQMNVRW